MTDIYAVHTDDGAPINESALCEDHLHGEWLIFARAAAFAAEDRPDMIEFKLVERPESNDTVCVECRLGGATS